MDGPHHESAIAMRARLVRSEAPPRVFRDALLAVPSIDRDAWIDAVLAQPDAPADGPSLPRGGVPYLPAAVDVLLRAADAAAIGDTDVVVDIGSGTGRATTVLHLLTGASTVGLEIQPELAAIARALEDDLGLRRSTTRAIDAALVDLDATFGTVFFLYCPFGGERLARVLAGLEHVASKRALRVCAVDLPLPPVPWLVPTATSGDLAVYTTTRRD